MYKLFIIIDLSDNQNIEYYKNTIDDFAKELNNINLVDVSYILNKKSNNIKITTKSDLKIIQPKNYKEFRQILKIKNRIYMYGINTGRKYFFINFFLAKENIKKFVISNLGYNPENFNYFKKNFIDKSKIFLFIRLKYYFTRLLIILNILPKIDYFFESSDFIYKSISKGLSNKIKKKFPLFNFSYYQDVVKINSRYFDNIYYSRYNNAENYIVFIDGMLFDHKDRIMREGVPSNEDREIYYNNLYKVLKEYEKIFKRKIVVCLHPKNNFSVRRGDFKDLKCVKYETEKYISESFLIFFHEGSSIIQAIVQNKNIINLHGQMLGDYINKRCEMYSQLLKLYRIDLSKINIEKEKIIMKEISNAKKNYEKYVKENIVNDRSLSGILQVIKYLKLQ